MGRVTATSEEIECDGDYGSVPGLLITCSQCGHEVEVFGTDTASARRGGVMLREECPNGAHNFYVVEGGDYEEIFE